MSSRDGISGDGTWFGVIRSNIWSVLVASNTVTRTPKPRGFLTVFRSPSDGHSRDFFRFVPRPGCRATSPLGTNVAEKSVTYSMSFRFRHLIDRKLFGFLGHVVG